MFKNDAGRVSFFFSCQILRTAALVQEPKDWVPPGQYGISHQKSRLMPPYSYEIYLGIGFVKDSFKDRKIKGKKIASHILHIFQDHWLSMCVILSFVFLR